MSAEMVVYMMIAVVVGFSTFLLWVSHEEK